MWTPEETSNRKTELLEFINNEVSAKDLNRNFTEQAFEDSILMLEIFTTLNMMLEHVRAQKAVINGQPQHKEYHKHKGISNYISSASLEDLEDLERKILYHLQSLDKLLGDSFIKLTGK